MATRNLAKYFNYDELTWPEAADLPRDTPLVLPLGTGHDTKLIAEQLSNPPQIGLLPPFPFGWQNSGLALPEPFLGQYVVNLIDSLHKDGFTRVYAITPQEVEIGPGDFALSN